ncbi:MAG TPA: phospholipid carrier-dependent glycosyltransferase, partial [Ktedonobacterales bacterium]|nr:phospholipid carrier-dependent glycosyltransferase [Ktedonobacterales bacterium]
MPLEREHESTRPASDAPARAETEQLPVPAPSLPPIDRTLPAAALRVAAGALWVLAIFLAYYTVHKPITATDLLALRVPPVGVVWSPLRSAARMAGAVADLVAVAWLLLVAGAVGQALWRAARLPEAASAEARLIGTILGLGALGLAAFALGVLGLLAAPVAYVLLGLPTLLLARDAWAMARWWMHTARRWWRAGWMAGGKFERIALLFAVATAALVLLGALLPPTSWDALAYHLPVVRADIQAGRVVLDPASPQGYQPQLMEMLYALLWLVRGGDSAAQPLHAACGLLVVALVACLAWRAGGPRAGVRATALVLAIPLVTTIAAWPYVDLLLAACELGAVVALARWHVALMKAEERAARASTGRPYGWLLVAAVAAGLALDVKYTGVYGLVALAVVAFGVAWRTSPPSPLPYEGRGGQRARIHSRVPARGVVVQAPRMNSSGNPILVKGVMLQAPRIHSRGNPVPAIGVVLLFVAVAALVGGVWPLRNLLLIGDPIFPYHLGPLFAQGPNWDPGRTAYMEGGGWGLMALWRVPLLPLETTLLGSQQSVEFDGTLGPLLLLLLTLAPLTLAHLPALLRGGSRWGGRRTPLPPCEEGPEGMVSANAALGFEPEMAADGVEREAG